MYQSYPPLFPSRGLLFVRIIGFMLLGYIGGCLALSGSGCATQSRVTTAAYDSLTAARDGFVLWDDAHQQDIKLSSPTEKDKALSLASYRAARAKVTAGFVLAFTALTAAAVNGDAASIQAAADSVRATIQALHDLGVTP